MPLIARLYDGNGVLLAENTLLGASTYPTAAVPEGLAPQARLTAGGLTAGRTYFVQVLAASPGGAAAGSGAVAQPGRAVSVGLGSLGPPR